MGGLRNGFALETDLLRLAGHDGLVDDDMI